MPIYEVNGRKANVKEGSIDKFLSQYPNAKLVDSTPYYLSRAKSTGRQSNISKQTDTQVEETPVQQHNNGIAGGYTTFQDGTSGFIPAMKMPDIKIEQPKLGLPKSRITKGTPFESKTFAETAQETMRNMPIRPEAQFDIAQSTYKQNQDWIKEVQNDPTISPEVKQALLDDYKKNIRISDNTIEDKDLPLYAKKWLEENKVSVPATVYVPGSPMFGGGQYVESTKQVNTPEQIAFIKDFIANTPQGQDLVNRQKAYVEYLENSISDVETRVQELKEKYWQEQYDLSRSHPYPMGKAKGKAETDAARKDYLEKYGALTKRMSALNLAEKNAEEQKKLLAAVRDGDLNAMSQFGKQIGRDFWEMAGDIGTLGIRPMMQSLYESSDVKGLKKRMESGEPLSEEDRLAMSALANNQAYQELMGDRRTIAQEVASGITQSAPFMVNFATTGGIGKAVTDGAKELLKQGIKRNAVNAIKQGAKIGTEKIGARLAGFGLNVADAVGRSSIMAAISLHTYRDMFDNMTGQVTYGYDEDGKPYYLGNIEQMDVADALLNAWGANTIENVSEFSGFGMEKGQAALSRLLKQRVPEVAKALSFGSTRNQFFQGVNQAMERAGFNGTVNEFLEEQVSTVLHSFFEDGQAQWSDLVDPRQQFITYLTVAAIGSGSAIMNTGGNQLMKYGAKKAYNNAFQDFGTEFYNSQNNDIAGQFADAVRNGTIEEKQNSLADIVNSDLFNDKQKLAALNLYRASLTYDAYEGNKTAQVEEATQEIPAMIEENVNPEMGAVVSATIAGMDTPVQITGGNIVQNEDGTINREQSDQEIYYTDAEGKRQVTSINYVENVTENIPTQDAITQVTEQVAAPILAQQQNEEVRPYQSGETVRFSPDGNTSLIGQIEGQDQATGSYLLSVETPNGIQQMQVQPRQIINEDNLLGVENGSAVIYTNQNGEQLQDVVATTPDLYAQGLIGFENGDVVKIEKVIGLAENSNWPQMDKETFIPDDFDIENQKNTEKFQLTPNGQNTIPFIEQIPQNESGNLLFEQVPVEMTLGALNEVYSDAAELSGVVDASISNIQKQIDKAKSPKPTGDINKDIANKRKANQQIEELKNSLSYWQNVRNAIQQSRPIEQRVTEQLTGKEPQTINLDKEKKPKTVNRNTPFKRRLNAVEENVHSIRDRILYGIASGTYKFRWKDQGVSMGLARELGLTGSEAERRSRIGLLSNNGYTPSTLAHHIWEETGMNLNDNDIRSEIIDVLNSVYSRKQALETLENSAGITEEQYLQEQQNATEYELQLRAEVEARYNEIRDQLIEEDLVSLRDEAVSLGATSEQIADVFAPTDYIDLIEQLKDGQQEQTSDRARSNEQTENVESEGNLDKRTQRTVSERNRSDEDTGDQRQDSDSAGDRINLSPEEQRVVNEATAQIDAGIAEARKELTTQQKELSSARKRLGKAQADTQGNLFGSEQQSKLFDVPADLSKENAVDNILSPIQQQIDAAQTNLDTLTNSRDARIQEALDNYRKQGKVFEEVTPRNLATEKGYNPAHFKKGDFVIDKYRRDIYEIIEPDKRGMAVLENIKTKWRQDYNAHNNAHFILYEQTIEDKIAQAEAETVTNPTEAQKEAGNYKKGKVTIQGFEISIEQPKGSVRSGVDENGKTWSVTMNNTYGYIRKTEGKDGDHIDVFLGENPESNRVFVVDQVNQDGSFDEHKVMLGFNSALSAKRAYLSNYEKGWQGLGNITEVDIETFRKWTESNTRRIKPFAEYKEIKDLSTKEDNILFQAMTNEILKAINNDFNTQLQQQIDDTLPKKHTYRIGYPSPVLQSAGIPNLPIELQGSRLSDKSMQENHPFDLSEVMDLPFAVQNPLAVFRSATRLGHYVILTEIEHEGNNFVVAIETNRKRERIEVNSIRSIYPKYSKQIANWINEELLEYTDKKRMPAWLSKQRSNSADVRKLYRHASKIVNEFENPKLHRTKNHFKTIDKQKFGLVINQLFKTGLAVDVVLDGDIRSNPELRDTEGSVYGYVNSKGIIHLDATRMNANTPTHEFGHLWNNFIKKNNTELYQKGVELIKQSPYYWEHVYNNPAYSNLSEDRKIDEALAMAIGDKGEGFVNRNMRQRFVDWLSEVWKAIKKAFGINIDIAIEDMTLSDFTDLATKQLLGGEKLTDTENYNTFGTNETRKQQNEISLGSSEEKLRGSDEASSREQEASIYLRRRIEAAREEQQRPLTEREIIDVEKRAALDYAKENNLWINDIYDLGIPFPGGGNENTLAYDVDKRIIYKSNNLLNTKGSISRLLNQIQINNELFPETKYNLIGFTGIDNGNKNTPFIEVVMSQNYIPNAIQATPEDIEVYMRAKGFDKINDSSFTNGVYTVSDLYPRNVLKDNDNNIYVVDNIIEENSSKDIIRFQSVNDVADAVGSNMTEDVKKKLNDELNKTAHKIAEAWFDRWLPVKKMLQTLEKSGLKIEDHNNWYLRADAVTSSIQSQYEGIFYNCYMLPFLKSISAIESKGYTLRDIENYALLKGGLERNEIKRSEAINKYKTEHPDATKEQIEAFEKQLPSDYAGVTAIEEEIGISADEYISDFENNVGNNHIADFWKKKNAATNYTLKRIYDSGGISKSEYDKLLEVKYYVPFRGHDKQTAEDLYDYSPNMGVYFSNPMIKANGRRTRAENPFAYIDQMGLSAIKFANWNSLNQSLYRLASKDKTNILTCDKAWYVQTGINEDNTPIWESQEPAYSDNSEQYRKNQDDFEKRMLELQKEGLAIQQRGRFDLDGLFIKPAQREQHRVPVWVNGNEYSIYINANPAIAQSINGTNLKQRVIDEQYKEGILKAAYLLNEGLGKTQRWMANNITSKSPEFMMRNLMRDVIQSATILPVKEGMEYEKDFLSNLPKSAAALTRYFAGKSNISNPTDAALVNFFLSGGATGYVHFLELQKNQKKINKEISDLKKSNFVKTYGFLKYIPDSIEAANKWAENLSRFIDY